MLKNRLLNVCIGVALLVTIALTVREAAATTFLVSQSDSAETVCTSLPARYSIHTEYVPERSAWVTYTEDGPAGVDGGLIQLLSDKRTCTR